jgi:uncharacterized protein YggE
MRASGFLTVFCLLMPASVLADEAANGLTLTGYGEVRQAPDLARFTFEVVRQGTDAAALKQDVDRVTAAVVKLAESQGVARADITAAVINVRPEYRYVDGRSVLEGVNVSRTVRVDLRNLEKYGAISNGAIEAGVNQITGVELDLADRSGFEQRALDAAVDQGTAEAAHVAARLGMKLGRVLEVRIDDTGHVGMPVVGRHAMSEKADDFRPGELVIARQVRLRYELIVP